MALMLDICFGTHCVKKGDMFRPEIRLVLTDVIVSCRVENIYCLESFFNNIVLILCPSVVQFFCESQSQVLL